MKILSIETSSPPGSVALRISGATTCRHIESTRRTTETFAVVIKELLRETETSHQEIDAVATTSGPGSFTGLRIGVTAAKVFCHVTGARLVAINTLELLAHQVPSQGEIEAVLNAQRGDLFAARFKKSSTGIETLRSTSIVPATEWISDHASGATLIGTGLERIEDSIPDSCQIVDRDLWVPRSDTLALVAESRLENSEATMPPLELTPQYFRRSAAEEKADANGDG